METKKTNKPICGFIGQGWIGKHYADDFEERGYEVIRYAKEEPHNANKDYIALCDIVFIAVPTPTTPSGFNAGILEEVLSLVGDGKIAVIKSTILPGTTYNLQKGNPNIIILHSPEFLSESTARHDAANPERNIIGIPKDTLEHRAAAELVFSVLPQASYSLVCKVEEAEFIKYAHNISGYFQVVLFNLLHDAAYEHGCDWEILKQAFLADSMMSHTYLNPIHKSGRGAGGHCLIKDFAAFRRIYEEKNNSDTLGAEVFRILEKKNIELLMNTEKDMEILREVYGDEIFGEESAEGSSEIISELQNRNEEESEPERLDPVFA